MPSPGITRTLRARFGVRAFVVSLIVLEMLAITSGIYWRRHLLASVEAGLRTHVESVASELALGLDKVIPARPAPSIFILPAPEAGVQILSADGAVLAASPRLADEGPLLPVGAADGAMGGVAQIEHGEFGHALVVASRAETATGSFVVEAVASLAEVDRTCRIMCLFVPAGMVALAALIGLLTHQSVDSALRPVRLLTRRAAEVADQPRPEPLGIPAHTAEFSELSANLDHMLEQIRIAFDREQSFLDDASHELRTPIAVALAEVDLAIRQDPDPGTLAALRSTREELHRLDRIASDLLVLARERSTSLGPLEPVDPADLARRALDLVQRDPRQRVVPVDIAGSATTLGEPRSLQRVFANLLANAMTHATGRVEVRVATDDGSAVTTVTDDGPGIPKHLLDDLFDRFTRLPDDRAHSTGLGTAIAAEIVAKHGGTITARNVPRGGAEIDIRLPATSSDGPSGI